MKGQGNRRCPFTNAWEQRKLGEISDRVRNNSLSRADLNIFEGEIKNIHYGDVLIKYGTVVDCQTSEIPYVKNSYEIDFENEYLKNGDVVFADAAEDATVGKAIEIAGADISMVVAGLHTIACRPKIDFSPGFLGYYLNSIHYREQLKPLMQGIKVLSLSWTNLSKTLVLYPSSVKEQAGLSRLFSQLDNLITLHQRKPFSINLVLIRGASPSRYPDFPILG